MHENAFTTTELFTWALSAAELFGSFSKEVGDEWLEIASSLLPGQYEALTFENETFTELNH